MTNPARWTVEHVKGIRRQSIAHTALISEEDIVSIAPDLGIWDAWPVQDAAGNPFPLPNGRELWMALGAPRFADPDERHRHARIHLVLREGAVWRHLGRAMPDGFSPGSREWSGSAVADRDGRTVTLYFTAAGRRGEEAVSFEQRMFSAEALLEIGSGDPRLVGWGSLREIIHRDPAYYMTTTTVGGMGEVGKIKAFRDPAFYRDPADGRDYFFFSGSCANSASEYNGVIGVARAEATAPTGWNLLPPIVSADALNNELERPHVIHHDGLYYLFWSTQQHVFDPAGPTGPTGLYGMVSDALLEGWRPINGTGLVFANPVEAPAQAYSWLVLPDLSVISFVDDWSDVTPRNFGGTFAPFLRLRLKGEKGWVEG
jgi:levansucrase